MKTLPTFALLSQKERIYATVQDTKQWNRITVEFTLVSLCSLALFGAMIATHDPSWKHVGIAALKMMGLVWGSLAICAPSLFVFTALRGSKLQLTQFVYLLIGALATTGIVLLALLPVAWFFLWTDTHLAFAPVLHGFVLALSFLFGLAFLMQGMSVVGNDDNAPHTLQERLSRTIGDAIILLPWMILFGVVAFRMMGELGPWY